MATKSPKFLFNGLAKSLAILASQSLLAIRSPNLAIGFRSPNLAIAFFRRYNVTRSKPVLVTPASPTPSELKNLSDIDDQQSLRFQIRVIQYYRDEPKMRGKDPANIIREALSKALVFYYPFAGRLREGHNGKLMVDCNGEGVLFIEADANVKLEQFGDGLQPPVPCIDELLYDVPGSEGIIGSPLLLIQVTRLLCGGFIVGIRLNHTMSDAPGLFQFLTAVSQLARGKSAPTPQPVWERHILNARTPPLITHVHREFDPIPTSPTPHQFPPDNLVHKRFFFGPKEFSALRQHLPTHLHASSKFELLAACIWRSRTISLRLDSEEEIRFMLNFNMRNKNDLIRLPQGYYGNAFVYPQVLCNAGQLCNNGLDYAVQLVKKTKSKVTTGYIHSTVDFLVSNGRMPFTMIGVDRMYFVSDTSRIRYASVDYGWGEAVYGGPADEGLNAFPGLLNFYVSYKKRDSEEGVVVPICLPSDAMDRFMSEVSRLVEAPVRELPDGPNSTSASFLSAPGNCSMP